MTSRMYIRKSYAALFEFDCHNLGFGGSIRTKYSSMKENSLIKIDIFIVIDSHEFPSFQDVYRPM